MLRGIVLMKPSPLDLAGNVRTFLLFWGLPIGAMITAIPAAHPLKTLVWVRPYVRLCR